MSFNFRDAPAFWRETLAVTGGAVVAGATLGVVGPDAVGLSLTAAAGGAALLGGSIGAALTRERPKQKALRAVLGVVGGALAAFGFAALTQSFGLGLVGGAIGGWLGGLAL